jgi:hypothetical protein
LVNSSKRFVYSCGNRYHLDSTGLGPRTLKIVRNKFKDYTS